METLEERIQRVVQEDVAMVPYNPAWPRRFEQEKNHLLNCLPNELIRRIEHFGSTAVPNLSAKPIVDMLVEVTSLVLKLGLAQDYPNDRVAYTKGKTEFIERVTRAAKEYYKHQR